MVVSVFSPCCQCGDLLPGLRCGPHQRARCVKFLDYIQKLNRIKASRVLLGELKSLICQVGGK